MRFRYIDEKGREVDLQTVEALAARIQLGAVHETSRLYDAVADKWAPAGEHELFKQLKNESEAKGKGPSMPSPLLGEVSNDDPGLRVSQSGEGLPPDPASPGAPPAGQAEQPTPEPLDLVDPDEPVAGPAAEPPTVDPGPVPGMGEIGSHLSDAWEPLDDDVELAPSGTDEEGGAKDAGSEAPDLPGFGDADALAKDGLDPEVSPPLDGLVLSGGFEPASDDGGSPEEDEEEESLEGLESGPSEGDARSLSGAAAMPGWAAAPPPLTDFGPDDASAGGGGAPPSQAEVAAEEEFLVRTASDARKSAARARAEDRMEVQGRPKRKRRRVSSPVPFRVLLLAALLAVVASAVTLLILRDPEALSNLTIGERAPAEAPTVSPARARPAMAELTPDQSAALAAGIQTGVTEALALLDSLGVQAGVGNGPPRQWLRGIYLANASDFPSVIRHWDAHRGFVAAASGVIVPRFRDATVDAIDARGFSRTEAEALYDEGGHWVAPIEWQLDDLLVGLGDLAIAALDLHDYLVSVEDRIRYDPFEDSSVPVDPVVEAIPLDEQVEEEMWGRIGRVADEFRLTQDLRSALPGLGEDMAAAVMNPSG